MIKIVGLRVNKNGRTICSVPRLEILAGERVAILGPNGSGKTTLLRVLSGLERTYEGSCKVDASWKQSIYVHQSPYLFRGTVLFNVTYGLRQRGASRAECDRLGMYWLQRFGLQAIARDRVIHLSGGERRRVALARAMILRPRLLLLDEPLADMDKEGEASVATALEELTETTILVASPTILPGGLTTRDYRFPSFVVEPI